MIKVGIIGMGMMGRTHFEAYQTLPNARVIAICDRNAPRASGNLVGTEGNVLGAGIQQLDMTNILGTTNVEELFNHPEIDLLDICTATPTHPELVAAAIKTGKHILCEKPLARTAALGREIINAARQSKGMFMTAMCMRFWPEWVWIKDAVAEKKFGRTLGATFRRVASMPPGWYSNGKASGGALLDLHIHDTDFVYYLFGMPDSVFSRGYSKTSGEVDHVVTQYHYDPATGPALVAAEGSWCLADGFGFQMKCTINCENATIDYDLARTPALQVTQAGKTILIEVPNETGYQSEVRYFVDCIEKRRQPEIVKLDDPVRCLEILEAEEKSIRTGGIVKL